MRKVLAVVITTELVIAGVCILAVLSANRGHHAPAPVNPYETEHHIVLDSKIDAVRCTANAIGPHTLLTAAHCILGTGVLKVDHGFRQILGIEYDEEDHAIIRVDGNAFPAIAKLSPRFHLAAGEHVSFIGNPGNSEAVRRDGSYTGAHLDSDLGITQKFQLAAFRGDSGASILDDAGEIIAVVSLANESCEVTALPMQFTAEQFARALK